MAKESLRLQAITSGYNSRVMQHLKGAMEQGKNFHEAIHHVAQHVHEWAYNHSSDARNMVLDQVKHAVGSFGQHLGPFTQLTKPEHVWDHFQEHNQDLHQVAHKLHHTAGYQGALDTISLAHEDIHRAAGNRGDLLSHHAELHEQHLKAAHHYSELHPEDTPNKLKVLSVHLAKAKHHENQAQIYRGQR